MEDKKDPFHVDQAINVMEMENIQQIAWSRVVLVTSPAKNRANLDFGSQEGPALDRAKSAACDE